MFINPCCARRLPTSIQGQTLFLARTNAAVRTHSGRRSLAQTIRTASANKSPSPNTVGRKAPTPKVLSRKSPPPQIQNFRQSRPALDVDNSYFSALPQTTKPILIYASPNHGSFFAWSYFSGLVLLLGASTWAQIMLKEHKGEAPRPWYVRSISTIPTLCMVGFGTVFLLAPTKLIRSISLMPPKFGAKGIVVQGPRTLHVEVKSMLPFVKPSRLEIRTGQIFVFRRMVANEEDIKFNSVPLDEAQSFTSKFFAPKPKRSILEILSSANQSMVDILPALRRDIRRMFLREQMFYIKLTGKGHFKLDMQDCHLLDEGNSLKAVTIPTDNIGLLGKFLRIFQG